MDSVGVRVMVRERVVVKVRVWYRERLMVNTTQNANPQLITQTRGQDYK